MAGVVWAINQCYDAPTYANGRECARARHVRNGATIKREGLIFTNLRGLRREPNDALSGAPLSGAVSGSAQRTGWNIPSPRRGVGAIRHHRHGTSAADPASNRHIFNVLAAPSVVDATFLLPVSRAV